MTFFLPQVPTFGTVSRKEEDPVLFRPCGKGPLGQKQV